MVSVEQIIKLYCSSALNILRSLRVLQLYDITANSVTTAVNNRDAHAVIRNMISAYDRMRYQLENVDRHD